jgi:glycerol-3-phosphate dehydrogenase
MAERIVDLVEKKLPEDYVECTTKKIPLTENPFENAEAVEAYILELEKIVTKKNLPKHYAFYLATNYGKQAELILENMQKYTSENSEINFAKAETIFCVKYEMVNSASDYFMRRTGRLFFDIPSISRIRKTVMDTLVELLNWDEKRIKKENEELDILIQDATTYYDEEIMA